MSVGGLLALAAERFAGPVNPDDNCCGDDQQGGEIQYGWTASIARGPSRTDGQVGSGVSRTTGAGSCGAV